ncbi:spore germination protein [Shimazuella alba]|uniref:Spore germination protein n=1 Tax=Shimazuella alba TaxID=2690964 RepID=A0A6I4VQG1_9BACL|nr:spore germination protein [Shimazuella alba]MXQ52515.1 spore germination protein [Shimazuella alba]
MNSNEDRKKKKEKKRLTSPYKPHKSSQEITVNENHQTKPSDDQNSTGKNSSTQDQSTSQKQETKESSQEQSTPEKQETKESSQEQSTSQKQDTKESAQEQSTSQKQETKESSQEQSTSQKQDTKESAQDQSTSQKQETKESSQEQSTSQKQETKETKDGQQESEKVSKEEEQKEQEPLSASLDTNIRIVKERTGDSQDIVIREIHYGEDQKLNSCFFYTEGLTDANAFHQFVLEPLMVFLKEKDWKTFAVSHKDWLPFIEKSLLPIGGVSEIENYDELFTFMLSGEVIFLMQGNKKGYRISLKSWKDRGVPETEGVVRGPRESFSETMRTNTALLRRRINSPRLRLEGKTIGDITKTQVSIMFIDGIADNKVLDEVRSRLDRIEIDGILESGYIEELIQDEPYSPFPTVHHTEKPDVVAGGLLEGRIAIIVDGTPMVLMVPALFNQFFQAAEDYYERSLISSLIRILRFICLFISLLAPAVYVAVTTFHQEMIPTPLLVNLMVQREGVPFPAFVEAFLMELMFEILREAGVRLPKAVGQTVSFVGALVIGQAAVEAGIVSAGMVIVVAITAISSFVIPAYNMAISLRILRFILMGISAGFGLYGVMIGLIVIVLHLCSIRSFGIPYMTPYGPYISAEFKDSIVRLPHWMMNRRPQSMVSKDVLRGNNSSPAKRKTKRKS